MTITEIATQYLHGQKLCREAFELSNEILAKKFARGRITIGKITAGIPCNVPDKEQKQIRDCVAERDRLKSRAAELTMARLCYLHKVSHHTVMAEIDRMRGIAA